MCVCQWPNIIYILALIDRCVFQHVAADLWGVFVCCCFCVCVRMWLCVCDRERRVDWYMIPQTWGHRWVWVSHRSHLGVLLKGFILHNPGGVCVCVCCTICTSAVNILKIRAECSKFWSCATTLPLMPCCEFIGDSDVIRQWQKDLVTSQCPDQTTVVCWCQLVVCLCIIMSASCAYRRFIQLISRSFIKIYPVARATN